jgi:hypothetical protein
MKERNKMFWSSIKTMTKISWRRRQQLIGRQSRRLFGIDFRDQFYGQDARRYIPMCDRR